MDLYKNKYRIPSNRLRTWNYGSPGLYFITICTQNHECYFGKIENEKMILNELGVAVHTEWEKTLTLRPDMNLELDEFVVMPNHFHGIIMIGQNEFKKPPTGRDALRASKTQTTEHINPRANKFGPQKKNIGSIIGGFKSAVTKYAMLHNIQFDWQERFHDHIIRNHAEYLRIANYIQDNPGNWGKDKFYKPGKPL
jgi:putative transposase